MDNTLPHLISPPTSDWTVKFGLDTRNSLSTSHDFRGPSRAETSCAGYRGNLLEYFLEFKKATWLTPRPTNKSNDVTSLKLSYLLCLLNTRTMRITEHRVLSGVLRGGVCVNSDLMGGAP